MENNFEKDKNKLINNLWAKVPSRLKPVVIVAAILIGVGILKLAEQKSSIQVNSQNQSGGITAQNVNIGLLSVLNPYSQSLPCRFYIEVLANVKELERILADLSKSDFNISNYKFIVDDYDKYDPSYGAEALDQQIKNFYVNLKKLPFGYAPKDIAVVKDQGNGVLHELSEKYGCRDYFEGDHSYHAASADSVIVAPTVPTDARHVVSGSTVVIKPNLWNEDIQNKK